MMMMQYVMGAVCMYVTKVISRSGRSDDNDDDDDNEVDDDDDDFTRTLM